MPHYTPTQKRLLEVLGDDRPHPKSALMECLADDLATQKLLFQHLVLLRKKLREQGLDIATIKIAEHTSFQLVRLLDNPYIG